MKKRKGFLLVGVLFAFLLLLIIVPVMVKWVQDDTRLSVKDQKSSLAFGLAEAAVDRGFWKVKGSTATFAQAMAGTQLAGYNFDVSYRDIPGGSYRIKISSGPGEDEITVYGEGKDLLSKETRAIKAIYLNTSVPGPMLSGSSITVNSDSSVHWGPIMSVRDITGPSTAVHYPRKLSRQVVKAPSGASYSYDINGMDPPNTDSKEWWSNYNVPDLPVFDFDTMRSSAAATSTLNCQDGSSTTYTTNNVLTGYTPSPATCTGSANATCACPRVGGVRTFGCAPATCSGSCSGSTPSKATCSYSTTVNCSCNGSGTFNCSGACSGSCTANYTTSITTTVITPYMRCCHSDAYGIITCDYGDIDADYTGIVTNLFNQTNGYDQPARRDMDYTWFWDHNSTWKGYTGIKGTVIIRGSLETSSGGDDRYCRSNTTTNTLPANPGCVLKVPAMAWKEYQYPVSNWPARISASSNSATYVLGSNSVESGDSGGDLGVYGFLYIGQDAKLFGAADVYGSMWVGGSIAAGGNNMTFYNANLKVPTLNVVLQKESWIETKPSSQSWP